MRSHVGATSARTAPLSALWQMVYREARGEGAVSIIAHIHNTEGHDIGYVCGPPVPDKKGQRIIRHARGCRRHGQPFIRTAIGEISSEYICYACHRAYAVVSGWGDRIDGTHSMNMPRDWWGWPHAQALEVTQLAAPPLWVRERGLGLAHYQQSFGFRCGRAAMLLPIACKEPTKVCQRCIKKAMQ